MAESDVPAQIAVIPDKKCELCDLNDITFKCLNCDELICDHCKKIHLKSKMTKNHKVVCLKSADVRHGSGSQAGNKKCPKHTTEDLLMYCNSCHVPVCRECITTGSHLNHPMSKIEDMIDSKQAELQEIIRRSKERSNKYEVTVQTVDKNRKDFTKSMSKRIEKVKARNTELKSKLDKITSDLIQQLESLEQENTTTMTHLEQGLQRELNDLKHLIQQCQDKQRDRDIQVVQFVADVKQRLGKYRPCDLPDEASPPELITRKVDDQELKALFGDLDIKRTVKVNQPILQGTSPPPATRPTIDVKQISKFTSTKRNVAAVSCDQAWLWTVGIKGVSLVSSTGDVIQDINTDFKVHDAAVNRSGELLLTVNDGNKIKKLTSNKQCTDIYTAATGYQTCGLTVTDTGTVIVVLYKYNDSKLIEIRSTGQHIRTIQYDNVDNTALFDNPWSVCTNINGDIIVVDYGKVVVVDKSGCRRFIYDGEGRNLRKRFGPEYAVTDKYGHIIISDWNNSVLHLLNQNGKFIQYLITEDHGCNSPQGMSIDTSGRLWVVNVGNQKVIILKYV